MNLPNVAIEIIREIKITNQMKKKLITLAKGLDFKTEQEYFEYMISSYINGCFTQCKDLFNDMKKDDQKQFLIYMRNENDTLVRIYDFYFNLL